MPHYLDQLIVDFLKSSPKTFFSSSQIARKAVDRQTYEDNPRWAIPLLSRLRDQELIEQNDQGLYCYLDPDELQERREKARNRAGR